MYIVHTFISRFILSAFLLYIFSSPIIIFIKVDISSKPAFIVESFKSPMPATIRLQNVHKVKNVFLLQVIIYILISILYNIKI